MTQNLYISLINKIQGHILPHCLQLHPNDLAIFLFQWFDVIKIPLENYSTDSGRKRNLMDQDQENREGVE